MLALEVMAPHLRRLGTGYSLPEVQALYEPLLAAQPTDGVQRRVDLRYGAHERHVLDVYVPLASPALPWPIAVCLHGGGFVRGDKAHKANFGWWFARHGILCVLPNYRLAPQSRWPSGPEDVVAVVRWLQDNARALGGDAQRIVLIGESAGAAHIAAATLLARFGIDRAAGVRGAALISGPYDPRLERLARTPLGIATPDPRNDAYFGTDDAQALEAMSLPELADAKPLPLLISMTQRDLPQMQVQAGALFASLVSRHGFMPEFLVVPEHNHFSQTLAINTGDDSLGGPLLSFVQRHA